MICKVVLLVTLATLTGFVTGEDPPQPQYRNLFLPVMDECKECVGASEEDVDIALNRGRLTTPTLKCLQYCMYNKIGAVNGVVMNETVAEYAYVAVHGGSTSDARNKVDRCYQEASESQDNACDVSAAFQECFRQD